VYVCVCVRERERERERESERESASARAWGGHLVLGHDLEWLRALRTKVGATTPGIPKHQRQRLVAQGLIRW
jgi:hypothetical protein